MPRSRSLLATTNGFFLEGTAAHPSALVALHRFSLRRSVRLGMRQSPRIMMIAPTAVAREASMSVSASVTDSPPRHASGSAEDGSTGERVGGALAAPHPPAPLRAFACGALSAGPVAA